MNGRNRELLAHIALALARYEREVSRDGVAVPAELAMLRLFVTDCAQRRPEATDLAGVALLDDSEGMTEHPLLSRREAAAALRCSTRTIDRLVARGELVAVRIAGSTKVRRADLDAYVAGLVPGSFREQITEKGTAC